MTTGTPAAQPLVTVLIPAKNEVSDIVTCIDHVAAQDYPLERIEVVVVDGVSLDGTEAAARAALEGRPFHHGVVLRNTDGSTPSNLNVGLRYATGEIICRVDARTRIEPHYVRTCVELLVNRTDLAVVGGAQVAVPRDGSARAVGIARALNNRYSMGGSPYRRAARSGPSDTVYLGAFRRSELLTVRGWDEALGTNQDFDLNRRMARSGTIWFEASLRSGYVPRATYRELWRQYVRFGSAKVRYWRMTGDRPQRRQQILLLLPLALLAAIVVSLVRGRAPAATGLGLAALVGVEHVGTPEPRGSVVARPASVLAILCIGAGWTLGAWREAARR